MELVLSDQPLDLVSRPEELHPWPLAERSVRLSPLGELERIVTEALDRYHDHDLSDRWAGECADIENTIFDATAEVRAEYAEALRPYREQCERLAFEVNDLRDRLLMVFGKMTADMTERCGSDTTLLSCSSQRSYGQAYTKQDRE
jgi:hypothetical protein